MKTSLEVGLIVHTEFGIFLIGQKVTYNVYPYGNMKGVICAHGIQVIGEDAVKLHEEGVTTFASFKDSQINNISRCQ